MFSNKSCLTCAFCLHCRDSFYGFPKPEWDYKKDNLTEREILQLEKGDISFLSEAKRKREEWIATYEKRKEEKQIKIEEEKKKLENSPLGKILGKDFINIESAISKRPSIVPLLENDPYPQRKEFGMEPCPEAPDYEYLECHKEIWGEKDENIWTTLKNKKCDNYYPLSKKETKTLNACDEERKERADNKKFWRGAVIGFISAFVIMILRFLLMPYFTSNEKESTVQSAQIEQRQNIEGKDEDNK